jgi:hypothetical protein
MKVYLVSRSQGDYDENIVIAMNIWQDKRDAEKYVERCKRVFPYLFDFYSELCHSGDYEHPLYSVAQSRYSTYEPAVWWVEEFELR